MPPPDIRIHAEHSLFGSARDQHLPDEDALSVAELIPQILAERQSLLHISEQLIAAEIAQAQPPQPAAETPPPSPPAADDGSALELFRSQKDQLVAHLGSALNETSLSLDFVSLLMSAERPRVTALTLSPHLQSTAPLGSLSADRLRPADARAAPAAAQSVGLGWKYQALRGVTALFRDAARQLRGQAAEEACYWRHVCAVVGHGEVLFKTRDPADNGRALGVQYGYGDSGLTYHDKGVGVLRRAGAEGAVAFCALAPAGAGRPAEPIARNRYTRVRVLTKVDDDYVVTGQLAAPRGELARHCGQPLLDAIERARFFLFEADLFFHLVREAKHLISYNVTIIADKIVVDAVDQVLEFESAVYDDDDDDDDNGEPGAVGAMCLDTSGGRGTDDGRAQSILVFLKLMLCAYYRYRLRLKQKMPTLHTKWKQAHSHPLLLRPLLGHTRHQLNVRLVAALVRRLCRALDPARASYSVAEDMYANLAAAPVASAFQKAVQRPVSTVTLVLARVGAPLLLHAVLEVSTTEIFVDLVVRLSVSKYKTRADLDANLDGCNVLLLEFTDLADVGESLEWALLNFLEDAA
ncbi:hypothetical protein METBIDRAFT_38861 [Metschnikowia bicuspidata var. bicuspidata NRRL YB-4993]|uniref:Mediator of RNA polymerase II transcription subunit 17 n=1 Tax=Metschnikowia bicuspidata var. bicuspidata NRRL YB-4993 TaxID=869754 RepID=A0A1A0HF19_9ASCO|nr:hypothetical protein METBIDRAFT_38861 [Metschnikowia bicuspidata var. bicuspidata NRRL YB-4993]OBA22483.1 hypothetical protein METBIDRAFT_38861 [Metschnikowia bicuspidata var. bicuspidata NRRL YB-4993]